LIFNENKKETIVKKLALICCTAVLFSNHAMAADYTDHIIEQEKVWYKADKTACKLIEKSNYAKRKNCIRKKRMDRWHKGNLRGTHEYVLNNYSKFTPQKLKALLSDLEKKRESARPEWDRVGQSIHELTQAKYTIEISEVKKLINKVK